MPEFVEHKCGIGGVVDLKGSADVNEETAHLGERLTHRGGKAYGQAWVRDGKLHCHKGNGRVKKVVRKARETGEFHGTAAIFNDRYITCGGEDEDSAQPMLYGEGGEDVMAMVYNGNARNFPGLKKALEGRGLELRADVDTDALGLLIWESIYKYRRTLQEAYEDLDVIVDGAYNLVMLERNGRISAYRDPGGFHPLFMSKHNGRLIIASEDQAIRDVYGSIAIDEITPGSMVQFTPATRIELQQLLQPRPSHCFFEAAYFADVNSTICGTPVHRARYFWGRAIGKLLKEQDRVPKKAIITPVPHSAKAAASGLADELDRPRIDAIIRNFPERGYTKPTAKARRKVAKDKYTVVERDVRGRRVLLVDDSIVRGTTIKPFLINKLREAGAKEIHLCLASPPFFYDCNYGINIKREELIAPRHSKGIFTNGVLPGKELRSISGELDVDSVTYLPVNELASVFEVPEEHLCTECVTGKRPPMNGRHLGSQRGEPVILV